MLLPGLRSSVHQRLQQRCQVLGMDTCSTATHFYPLLLPLVSMISTQEFVFIVFILQKNYSKNNLTGYVKCFCLCSFHFILTCSRCRLRTPTLQTQRMHCAAVLPAWSPEVCIWSTHPSLGSSGWEPKSQRAPWSSSLTPVASPPCPLER